MLEKKGGRGGFRRNRSGLRGCWCKEMGKPKVTALLSKRKTKPRQLVCGRSTKKQNVASERGGERDSGNLRNLDRWGGCYRCSSFCSKISIDEGAKRGNLLLYSQRPLGQRGLLAFIGRNESAPAASREDSYQCGATTTQKHRHLIFCQTLLHEALGMVKCVPDKRGGLDSPPGLGVETRVFEWKNGAPSI